MAVKALREYRCINGLRRGPMLANGLKKMMMKFENTGDFGVAPGRGRQPIPMEVVDEVAVAVADRAPNFATSAQAVSHEWVSHGQQLEKFYATFYTGTPTRFRLCSNEAP